MQGRQNLRIDRSRPAIATADRERGDSFKQHGQLSDTQLELVGTCGGNLECASLQALGPHCEAVPVPVQDLYIGSAAVYENEQCTAENVLGKIPSYHSRQAVESPAHVRCATVQEDSGGTGQGNHRWRPLPFASTPSTSCSVCGSNPRSKQIVASPPIRILTPEAQTAGVPPISSTKLTFSLLDPSLKRLRHL